MHKIIFLFFWGKVELFIGFNLHQQPEQGLLVAK
jgi:hypothetical protein